MHLNDHYGVYNIMDEAQYNPSDERYPTVKRSLHYGRLILLVISLKSPEHLNTQDMM